MKARKFSKKILAAVLSAVMILSSMVFAVNTNTASAATAGKYYVRVSYEVTNGNNIKGSYGGFNKEVNDSAGISVGYKGNNGTSSTVSYQDWDIKSCSGSTNELKNGSYTVTATLSGFPTILYCYMDDNYALGICQFQVKKLEVSASSNMSNPTTLWTGVMQVSSRTNPYAASVSIDGSSKIDYFGSDADTFVSNSSGAWDLPKADSVTGAAYASSSLTAPKPGEAGITNKVNTANLITKDQYGVVIGSPSYTYVQTATAGVNSEGAVTTVSQFANLDVEPYYKDVYMDVRGSFNNATVKQTISFRVNNCQLSYSFKNYNGTTITGGNMIYGKTPDAPANPTKAADAENHYTFNGWDNAIVPLKEDTVYTAQFTSAAHNFGTPAITNPDCENDGESVSTCADCAYVKRETLPKLGHTYNLITSSPADGVNGYSYFVCDVCSKAFNFVDSNTPGDETDVDTAKANGTVPAPFFNTCSKMQSNGQLYDYTKRGAALLVGAKYNATQMMRFAASMQIPEGATVEEVGYVYSLSNYVATIDFVQGANRVYTQPCTNYTDHGDGILTYNLLIDIKRDNWKKLYAARAYVTYNYKGVSYTVYDKDYASKSVYKVATAVVNSDTESAIAKAYCQEKIIDYLEA